MNVLSPFDETVRDLTLAQHLPRIKKLLVYACTQHWESDAAGLMSYHLHDLVQQLLQVAPTFDSLKVHLNGMIQTLNKPAEYTLVGNTIVRHLQHLYSEATPHSSDHYKALYRIAAQHLEQDDDVDRMKKLIHFVCRDQWTHDIDAVKLHDLIEELHSLTPTPGELIAVLDSVVQTVSKPDKYRAIAQRIIHGLAPLYHPTTHILIGSEQAVSVPSETQGTDQRLQPSRPPQIHSEQHVDCSASAQAPELQPKDGGAKFVSDTAPASSAPFRCSTIQAERASPEKRPKPISMRKKVASLSPEDLFELRNEIQKFANPLLAKYLLFMNCSSKAVKHDRDSKPGQWDIMVWDALKANDLDTLLCDGLKNCRNLGEFERSLKRTARQFKGSKQYSIVITAIVRAVAPTFADCQDIPAIVYPAVREEAQGMPTYGKRQPLDGPLSKPLSQDLSEKPVNPSSPSSSPQIETLKQQKECLKRFSKQETSLETAGLETASPEIKDLDPIESESYLETTEAESPFHVESWPSQSDPEDYDEALFEQAKHLEQRIEQPLSADTIQPGNSDSSGDETAYLVGAPPASGSSSLVDQWSAASKPTLNRQHHGNSQPAQEKSVDETCFLPAP